MKVTVNNYYKDEKAKKENVNKAFVEIVKHRTVDRCVAPVVSCSKGLFSHDTDDLDNKEV